MGQRPEDVDFWEGMLAGQWLPFQLLTQRLDLKIKIKKSDVKVAVCGQNYQPSPSN